MPSASWSTMRLAFLLATAARTAAAGPPPHIFWATDDVRPGETVMLAGWPFTNRSRVFLDGHSIPVAGVSGNAIMATLPPTATAGTHTITVQDETGQSSNSLILNAVDVWWCLGDGASGVEVAAGGTIRCFGRGFRSDAARDMQHVDGLREALVRLSTKANLSLVDVRALLKAAENSTEPSSHQHSQPPSNAILRLRPTSVPGRPIDILAGETSLTRNSATFAIPADTAAGTYTVSMARGNQESKLQMFLDPMRPQVDSVQILRAPASATGRFNVTSFGRTGINHTMSHPAKNDPNKWHATPINATTPLLSAIKAAAAAATSTGVRQEVMLPAGVYHIDGPIIIPDGVSLVGEGSDLSAVYFSYDNASTAPLALIAPDRPGSKWGLHNLTLYVLSMYKNLLWVPGENVSESTGAVTQGEFHMSGVVIRASAFHCRSSVTAYLNSHRSSAWWPGPLNETYGGQHFSGYQPAVVRLGALVELPSTVNPPVTRTEGLPARNVIIENCDIYGSWNIFQGRVQHATFRSNQLWNGMQCFYLEPLETTIEHNTCTGSSETAGGNGLNFAQHVFFYNNTVLNVRANDREVMTYDAEGVQFSGAPTSINGTVLTAPNCPGILNARFDLPRSEAAGTLPVSNPRGGLVLIIDGPGAGQYRRIVDWGAKGDVDTEPCWWQLDRPFDGSFDSVDVATMKITITFFQGESIFAENRFEDTGHFQTYHSSVSNVVAGHSLARMEGMWSAGMSSAMRSAKNNSILAEAPHPSFFNEFVGNRVRVGHRAPHQPDVQTRDTFWSQEINHDMASFGISGQDGHNKANRFVSFRRNCIRGMNGIGIWGEGNGDVLVEGNYFERVEQPITYDFFPDDLAHPTVQNVVVRDNTPALGPAPAPPLHR